MKQDNDKFTSSEPIYLGDLKDGIYHGMGILKFSNGFKYVGEFKQGEYDGMGILYDGEKRKYVGEFHKGQKCGLSLDSIERDESNNSYKYLGELKDGGLNGPGIKYHEDLSMHLDWTEPVYEKYYGEFKDGKYNGSGMIVHDSESASISIGKFKDGLMNGLGMQRFKFSHEEYFGSFKDGIFNGYGHKNDLRNRWVGFFEDWELNGYGIHYRWLQSQMLWDKRYEGKWKDDKKHGKGFFKGSNFSGYGDDKGYTYEGDFYEDEFHGIGVMISKGHGDEKKYRYEGEFHKGLKHGKGILTYETGEIYTGEFINGKRRKQNYKLLFESYTSDFMSEYGTKSTMGIIETIQKSKHSINLLHQSATNGFVPTVADFNSFVLSNLSLSFSKKPKIRFASIILFNHWHNDVNVSMNLLSEDEVVSLFNRIREKTI